MGRPGHILSLILKSDGGVAVLKRESTLGAKLGC